MSRLIIRGGKPLSGEITASGNKNAVLPMIAAALLTDEEVVLTNVPDIRDVRSMLTILAHLGAEVAHEGDRVSIRAADVSQDTVPRELCEASRTSFMLVAPLLARCGRAKVFPPGGDGIGRRRLDSHLYGLRRLGAEIDEERFEFAAPKRLHGQHLFFDEASVTATEHILMAAVLAEGTTVLLNAASEPHVQDLAQMLCGMGAQIEGIATNTLTITGVDRLAGTQHRVVSDHIEVGSYLALAAATGGAITIRDTVRGHYWMIHRVFERLGIQLQIEKDHIRLESGQAMRIQPDAGGALPRIDDGPWPQFATDMMSAIIVLATQCEGSVLFFEKMFESRLFFVDPLVQMGANIVVCDPHRAIVTGKTPLRGQTVRSPDIRAGMALLIGALCAGGEPCILHNAQVIDRGYESVDEKLRALGADVERVED